MPLDLEFESSCLGLLLFGGKRFLIDQVYECCEKGQEEP